MSLSNVQQDFASDIGQLIRWADNEGYGLTFGDAYRSPKAHGDMGEQGPYGEAWSAHKQRLAVDFNLFIDGEWQQSSEAFRPLGEYWKSLNPDNVWGGDFKGKNKGDGNHFSRRWNGIA